MKPKKSGAGILCLAFSVAMAGCNVDIPDTLQTVDSEGNVNTQPVMFLRGSNEVTVVRGQTYRDPGVVAYDAEDGDITAHVTVSDTDVASRKPGTYTVLYNVSDANGTPASQLARRVTVVDNASIRPSSYSGSDNSGEISEVQLVSFNDQGDIVQTEPVANGEFIVLGDLPTDAFNFVAVTGESTLPGSVHFLLEGPTSLDRIENNSIYTMENQNENLSVKGGDLPDGDYSLFVTPYSEADGEGIPGETIALSFEVMRSLPFVDRAPSSVPAIMKTQLVGLAGESGTMVPLKDLKHGDVIDVSALPHGLVNVIAVSQDQESTGSVHFKLDGPVSVDRHENNPVYTMARESDGVDISSAAAVGKYTLRITPYAEPSQKGEAGNPYQISFTVANKGSAEDDLDDGDSLEPEPPAPSDPEPAPTRLVLNSDFFSVTVNSKIDDGSVAANDMVDFTAAQYSIVEQPKNGYVEMDMDGSFAYSPDSNFSGSDQFVYAVQQGSEQASQTATISVNSGKAGAGFTAFRPSADSKVIYVSASKGKDSNDCLSQASPCQSLAAGIEKMRRGKPDHLYLKAGDVWKNETINGIPSGKSPAEPAVLAYYGQGARPKIQTNSRAFRYNSGKVENLSIIGLHFHAYRQDPSHPEFTGAHGEGDKASLVGGHANILIEDCVFDLMELVIQDWDGNPSNITLRRNIFTGAYYSKSSLTRDHRPSNLYVEGVNGLLVEENVFDHGGWNPKVANAGANMYNHNLYIQYENNGNSIVVRNNIITRASSHGVHGRPGGLYENNFFGRNAVSLQMGYKNHPMSSGTFARAINNVITEGHSMIKGKNACAGNNLCTPAVWGLHTADVGGAAVSVKGNIVHSLAGAVDRSWSGMYDGLMSFGIGLHKREQTDMSGNIVWRWNGESSGGSSFPAPGRTLGDYYKKLNGEGKLSDLVNSGYVSNVKGGSDDFDAFMNLVLNRQVNRWDERLSADAVNDYVRQGFGR